jgi:hypothetical protein
MDKDVNKLPFYHKTRPLIQHYDMNTQGSNRYHPLPLDRLRQILLNELNLPDTRRVDLKSPIKGLKLKGGRKAYYHLWQTYIIIDNCPVKLMDKQYAKHDYWRGIGEQQYPKSNQYEFYRIELTPVNYEPYRTKYNYKVDESGGWTSDSPIFCKDGIYYAILT